MKITAKGKCTFCSKMLSKGGFTRHLKSCSKLHSFFETNFKKIKRKKNLYYLAINVKYLPEFWMHIAIEGNQTLDTLDNFLRNIWLECCGHLSQFNINETYYVSHRDEEFDFEDEFELPDDDNFQEDELEGDFIEGESKTQLSSPGLEKLVNFTSEFMNKIVLNNNDNPDSKATEKVIENAIDQTLNDLSDEEFDELEKLSTEFYNDHILNKTSGGKENFTNIELENIFDNLSDEPENESMEVKIQDVLNEKSKFKYVYDFGSSTELVIKVFKIDQMNYNFNSLIVLARNELPIYPCSSCDNEAEFLCEDCIYDENSLVCDACSNQHNHGSNGGPLDNLIKMDVNSPRFGVCGYFGDSE